MYKLFKANSTIRNLGLVLALLIRSIGSTSQIGGSGPSHTGPFNDGLCLYNENGRFYDFTILRFQPIVGKSLIDCRNHHGKYRDSVGASVT